MYSKRQILSVAGLLLCLSPTAHCQLISNQPSAAQMQFYYTNWELDFGSKSSTINQTLVPLSGLLPLKDNFEIRFFAASESNSLKRTNEDLSASGLTDVTLQVNHSFADSHLLLSGGLNLPTSKQELKLREEWPILWYLSQNYLDFPMRKFGEGFGFNLLLGGATMVGSIRCGLGISYEYTGSYEPYDILLAYYDPGDRLSVNAGSDYRNGGFTLSGNVLFGISGTDKFDDHRVFKQGPQTSLNFTGGYEGEKCSLSAGLGFLIRGRSAEYDPANDHLFQQLRMYGNEFDADVKLFWRPSDRLSLSPNLGLRHIGDSAMHLGTANLYCVGTDVGVKLSSTFSLDTGFKSYTGNADDDSIELTGYQLSVGIGASW